ncbi:hypothetical protein AB5I41_10410 [Sphingomonas sp. MMS24-JH45]
MRGGISIALALGLPGGPARSVILAATYVVVLFSVTIVQGGTIKRVLERMTPDKAKSTHESPPAAIVERPARKLLVRADGDGGGRAAPRAGDGLCRQPRRLDLDGRTAVALRPGRMARAACCRRSAAR